jgi:DNA-binding LacI/PurR family transcriptional regulator
VVPRRPTSADVAALAGVSRTTVSFVLNARPDVKIPAPTRSRVLDAAEQLGYHPHGPARQLVGRSSQTIGLVLRQSPEQVAGDAFLIDTLRGLALAARTAGFRVLVESLAPGDGSSYVGLLRSAHCDGLVISGPRTDDTDLVRLAREDFPLVIQGSLPGVNVPSVDVDNVAGARHAVDHLVALGHRRIACITNASLAYTAAAARLEGYRLALADARLAYDEALVSVGSFDPASGHRAMLELLARSRASDATDAGARSTPSRGGRLPFDAVFIASDVVALGAIGALRDHGYRVPDDVSVVGFDDIALAAYVDPPLTTVHLPAHELGLAAGRALLDRIAHREVAERTLLPTELVVRSSTAPAAGGVADRTLEEPAGDAPSHGTAQGSRRGSSTPGKE